MKNMKKIYTWAAGFALCAGLVSCEMKEELWGKEGEVPTETGTVELGVAVDDKTNVVITKAAADDTGEERPSAVDVSEYEVLFTHQEAEYSEKYVYEDIENKEVTLPIGKYTVQSHTPGTLGKRMTYPYYSGETQLVVTSGITSDAKVVCTMQNSRIVLTYDPEFSAKFDTWTITVDDGSETVLTFTKEMGMTPDAVYWHFAEDCASLQINVIATNANGEIRESRTITKPAGTENMNWTGGDALTITMEPAPEQEDPDNPSGVMGSGINIKVEAFFPDSTKEDDTIWVDVDGDDTTDPTDPDEGEEGEGETEEPDTPTTGSLSMTMPGDNGNISYSISAGNVPSSADVIINAPEGISSLVVKMSSTNDDFNIVIDDLVGSGLDFKTNGVEVVGNTTMAEILSFFAGGESVDIPALSKGDTSYKFPIAPFFKLINDYGGGIYTFNIVLKDDVNEPKEGTLTLTITD